MSVTSTPERLPTTWRTLLTLAWPLIISRATQSVIGVADNYQVSHLGPTALAATGAGAMNSFVAFMLPMGTMFIVASFTSQYVGRGDLLGARRFPLYGLLIGLVTEAVALLSLPFLGDAVGLLGFEAALQVELTGYLQYRLLSTGFVVGVEALGNYYGGLGNTRLPMLVNLCAMVLNIFGNWVLIDGNLGAPALGVRGAALASSLASGGAFLLFFTAFLRDGRRQGAVFPRLKASEFKDLLRFGLPSGFNWFFEFLAFLFFINFVVGGLGTKHLGAFTTVMNINSVAFMPAFALASAGAILCGQSIGAGDKDAVPGTVKLTFYFAAGWQTLIGLAYLLLPGLLFGPFARGDVALLALGARMLMLSSGWQFFDAAVAVLAESLRSAGDTQFPMWARTILAWAVFAPGSYFTVRVLGAGEVVAMLWVVGYIAVLAGVLLWRFRRGTWRTFELTASASPAH
jgi:MATE family multidrug resistance protein